MQAAAANAPATEMSEAKITGASSVQPGGTENNNESDRTSVKDDVAAEPEAKGEATLDQEVTPSENCDAPNAAEPSAEYVQKPEHAAPAGKDTMAAETVKDLP